ncbi:AEC family transporter [Salidesulfovibrio onnuriiensis]|uniref:AEC family transporter n=1 Tax=Salidesulfovibrio onnuriiensis TaxID=2583823 RepID=UPI0011C83E36|nr:AEC family transporter [Salidesulfovibrio onnuriiensis]
MLHVILAVAPVFGLVLLGCVLRRLDFPGQGFWAVSERLTYYVLFPAMLVQGLSGREFQDSATPLATSLVLAVVCVAGLLQGVRHAVNLHGPAFTSVFQGAIRPNTYVGLSLAAALLGPDWMGLSAVALLTLIPLVNLLCVLTLSRHGDNGVGGVRRVLLELIRNPLILACAAGMAMNAFSLELPGVLSDLLNLLGRAALPMGLLAVGAGLRFAGVLASLKGVAVSSAAHLVLLPLLAVLFCSMLGAGNEATLAAVIFTAIPVSVSSFILARQMGGDHQLMAQIITAQTVLSVVTLPVLLLLLG